MLNKFYIKILNVCSTTTHNQSWRYGAQKIEDNQIRIQNIFVNHQKSIWKRKITSLKMEKGYEQVIITRGNRNGMKKCSAFWKI